MPDAAPDAGAGGRRPNVLFICADAVGEEMAGLGIRCWELARTLSAGASVTVAHGGSEQGDGFHRFLRERFREVTVRMIAMSRQGRRL